MGHWILLWALIANSGAPAVTSAEFIGKEACESAGKAVLAMGRSWTNSAYVCVMKAQ